MINSNTAIREIAEMYLRDEIKIDKISPIQYEGMMRAFEKLISEHCVSMEKYKELLQQRDELKEALILAEGLIDMASDKEWAKIRAAIKNTKDETDTIKR